MFGRYLFCGCNLCCTIRRATSLEGPDPIDLMYLTYRPRHDLWVSSQAVNFFGWWWCVVWCLTATWLEHLSLRSLSSLKQKGCRDLAPPGESQGWKWKQLTIVSRCLAAGVPVANWPEIAPLNAAGVFSAAASSGFFHLGRVRYNWVFEAF